MTLTSSARRLFVLADPSANNNKFWEGATETAGLRCRWGRVGSAGQEKFYAGEGQQDLERRIREKTGKGYREVALIEHLYGAGPGGVDKLALSALAVDQLAHGDTELEALVKRLVSANRHEIVTATGGAITFNAEGFAQTAVGVVRRESVAQARRELLTIAQARATAQLESPAGLSAIASYMRLIPQKVGARKGWHLELFGTPERIGKQYDLLDQLEQSIEQAEKDVAALAEKATEQIRHEKLFEVHLSKVLDEGELERIRKYFQSTLVRAHASASLRIRSVFRVDMPAMRAAFEKDGATVGGIEELWHGTRTYNVLSILKSGLVIPKSTAAHVNGRMFGDGLYFADSSSKALNYSYGYWDRNDRSADTRCFMFLADVALGRAFVPPGRVARAPAGYDSVFAKAGVSGVLNNEKIIYRLGQANLKFLVEFEEG